MRLRRFSALTTAVALSGAVVAAQNGSQFREWKDTALADAVTLAPKTPCAALIALSGFEFSIASAAVVAATPDVPEYCRVVGLIQPEIRFEVNLPSAWNGRLYMFGNGGYAGEALESAPRQSTARRALARRFATAQTNTGHHAAPEPPAPFASTPPNV